MTNQNENSNRRYPLEQAVKLAGFCYSTFKMFLMRNPGIATRFGMAASTGASKGIRKHLRYRVADIFQISKEMEVLNQSGRNAA